MNRKNPSGNQLLFLHSEYAKFHLLKQKTKEPILFLLSAPKLIVTLSIILFLLVLYNRVFSL